MTYKVTPEGKAYIEQKIEEWKKNNPEDAKAFLALSEKVFGEVFGEKATSNLKKDAGEAMAESNNTNDTYCCPYCNQGFKKADIEAIDKHFLFFHNPTTHIYYDENGQEKIRKRTSEHVCSIEKENVHTMKNAIEHEIVRRYEDGTYYIHKDSTALTLSFCPFCGLALSIYDK